MMGQQICEAFMVLVVQAPHTQVRRWVWQQLGGSQDENSRVDEERNEQ